MIYTIDEIKRRIEPVAKEYGVKSIYLFGSYARGEATEESDVDLLVDTPETQGLFEFYNMKDTFSKTLGTSVDIVTTRSLENNKNLGGEHQQRRRAVFHENIFQDRVMVYEEN